MSEQMPAAGHMTGRGLVKHYDGRIARVTKRGGSWGYWENGKRTESFADEWDAARAFLATDIEARAHLGAMCWCGRDHRFGAPLDVEIRRQP